MSASFIVDSEDVSRLAKLNSRDLRDLIGYALFDRGRRIAHQQLVDASWIRDDSLGARVRPKRNAAPVQVQVQFPDGHEALALTLKVQCECGQPVVCEHAAALLVNQVEGRSPARKHPDAGTTAPTTEHIPTDTFWQGLRGPHQCLAPLLSQQKVNDVRKLAKRLSIGGKEKEALIQALHTALPRAEAVQAQVQALSPFQQTVLALLVLRDTPTLPADLHQTVERLGLPLEASIDETLNSLSNTGLALPTSDEPALSGTAWSVPLDIAPFIPVDRQALRLEAHARATRATEPTPPTLSAVAALHGLRVALLSRKVPPLPQRKPIGTQNMGFSVEGLRGWHIDPESLEQVRKTKAWSWQGNWKTTLALLPPDPLINESDTKALAGDIGCSPDLVRFLLRLFNRPGTLDTSQRRVRLRDSVDKLLARPLLDQVRVLTATWAWDTTWSEVDDMEGLVIQRRYLPTSHWRPDHLYAELAAVRRWLLRLLRALEPGGWYSVAGLTSLAFALQPRLLYEQHTAGIPPESAQETWWLSRPDGQRLDPHTPADWQHAEARMLRQMLQGPLCWLGLLEAGSASDGSDLVRITPLGAALLSEQTDYQAPPVVPALQVRADPQRQQMTMQVLLKAADASTLAHLARFAAIQQVQQGVLSYQTTPHRMRDAMQQGQTAEGIRTFLQASSREPLPAAVEKLLTQWGQAFGQAMLYNPVALIELADDLLLPELLRATRLDAALLEQLSPRLLLVDPQQADALFSELVAKGYTPRRVR